jgi:hypothetical protein
MGAMESIAGAAINLPEAIRFIGKPLKFYNAGSRECFGDTGQGAADEQTLSSAKPLCGGESLGALATQELQEILWAFCLHRYSFQL